MARKNAYGKYIISAGEIASYTVCPDAWRLSVQHKAVPIHVEAVEQGNRLHEEWAKNLHEAMYFTRSVKLILLLIVLTLLFFFIRFMANT